MTIKSNNYYNENEIQNICSVFGILKIVYNIKLFLFTFT